MRRDVEAMVDGAIGGAAGTAAMSAVMAAAARGGRLGEYPPRLIARAALDAVGPPAPEEGTRDVLAVAAHAGFGTAAGALFGVLHRRLRPPIGPALHGAVYASLVWGLSYQGWIPALGIMPPPERDRPGRPAAMLLAHWVYGSALGAVLGRRSRRGRRAAGR